MIKELIMDTIVYMKEESDPTYEEFEDYAKERYGTKDLGVKDLTVIWKTAEFAVKNYLSADADYDKWKADNDITPERVVFVRLCMARSNVLI